MAEEDIIFGKNRHFFGGIEPSNMKTFSAVATYDVFTDTNTVTITAALPTDTIINGQVICTVKGAVIRKSTVGYPKDEFDGELLANITSDGTLTDTDVVNGETYYYAAFPYTDQGVYNRSEANRSSATTFVVDYLYGYDLDTTDSNPATRVTYPSDVQNHLYSSAGMDYDAGTFNYGSWPDAVGEKFMPKPCMLKYDGTVDYYLDPNDYTKKEDGSASDVADSSYEGNAMMEWPKIYTKRWEEDGIYHFRCSDVKLDDDYECWCNYDRNDHEIDHFYTAIYVADQVTDPNVAGVYRIRSYSSNLTGETYSRQSSLCRKYARYNGDDWDIDVLSDRLLIQDLLVMMAKTTNGQTAYGIGRGQCVVAGSLNDKGMFWGTLTTLSNVKIFGMEDWYGGAHRRIGGLATQRGFIYYKITRGTKDGSTATDYTDGDSVDGYLHILEPGVTYGYGKTYTTTPFGRLPSGTADGSSSTYECDYLRVESNGSEIYTAYNAYKTSDITQAYYNGPFCLLSTWDSRSNDVSTTFVALSCKPSAT